MKALKREVHQKARAIRASRVPIRAATCRQLQRVGPSSSQPVFRISGPSAPRAHPANPRASFHVFHERSRGQQQIMGSGCPLRQMLLQSFLATRSNGSQLLFAEGTVSAVAILF
ncbi:hypothetical protein TIFTF001_017713 [Ficus carica]|uniref:Uncharacterized protein n=1 Tax=Ficus carica TaxID=3494 RepID=A0AA88A9R2_FICCA|nr:hypothetical protein TIFTF001_017713 [Ficus carica]